MLKNTSPVSTRLARPNQVLLYALSGSALLAALAACGGNSATNSTDSDSSSMVAVAQADCSTTTTQSATLLCLGNNFRATLSSSELASVSYALTATNATTRWSNLPVSFVARNGLPLSKLNATSKKAAEALISAALTAQGNTTMSQLRTADGYLATLNSDYGKDLYHIAFLGEPSASKPWMIQFTGHHYTNHISVNSPGNGAGPDIAATPMFVAVEPTTFSDAGVSYTPMKPQRDALLAMLGGLTSTQLAAAKLPQAYDDLLVPPQRDGKFPTTHEGVLASSLATSQQALVKAALAAYAGDAAGTAQLQAYSTADALSQTYISWASYADLATKGSYVRIDGPRVWIEFSVQGGIVIRTQNHYHSIWRDKTLDYGGNFSF